VDLDLRQVRYVVTLAEELHFGRAADRLTIAQQTLSSQIRSLEKRLGTPLFVRDRRHVALTPAGQTFVDRGRRLLADAAGLPAALLFRYLRTQTPDLPIEVLLGRGLSRALPRLLTGDLDIAFGRPYGLGRPLATTLATMPVGLEPIGVILPTDHRLADHGQVTFAALAEHPLLVHTADETAEWRDWVDQAVGAFGLRGRYVSSWRFALARWPDGDAVPARGAASSC
jgi:DNA-binding transcriptional LysR family regulator